MILLLNIPFQGRDFYQQFLSENIQYFMHNIRYK